jgi:hypothetical protein
MGEERGVYRVLVGKPEGKRPLVRHRHKRENNIEMNLQEVACEGMNWIYLAKDRRQVASFCKYGKEFSGSIKCEEFLD